MKHVTLVLAALAISLTSAVALACSVAAPAWFPTTDTGEGDPPPTPEIRVEEISRASGRDQASCDYLGRLHLKVENPGDYGLLLQVEGKAPFRFGNEPLLAEEDIHYHFDDADTRGENIDAIISVVPISATGVTGEAVSVPVAAEGSSLVACSTGSGPGGLLPGFLLLLGVAIGRRVR